MGRCGCGRRLIGATMQLHQKLGPIFITVCEKSNVRPDDCTEVSIVHVRKRPGASIYTIVYDIWVDDVKVGSVGKIPSQDWLWEANLRAGSPFRGMSKDRDSAVRFVLDQTTL